MQDSALKSESATPVVERLLPNVTFDGTLNEADFGCHSAKPENK